MDNLEFQIPICIPYEGMLLTGYALPVEITKDVPSSLNIYIQGWHLGTLSYHDREWTMDQPIDSRFVQALGRYIQKELLASQLKS